MWARTALERLEQDLRYGWRMLRHSPGFMATAVLSLALGIGANTAVFSAFDSLLPRPLPFTSSDLLVRLYSPRNGAPIQGLELPGGLSQLDGRDYAQANHTFQKIAVYDVWRKNVSFSNSQDEPTQMRVGLMPSAYFETLGIQPIMGRLFSEDENELGRHYVAAINTRVWKEHFGGSNAVLGQKIFINDEPYTIVAMLPDVVPEWMESASLGKV